MRRRTVKIMGLTIAWVMVMVTPFASAQTVHYDLSVTIPAIPGFNVPPFDRESDPARATSETYRGLELIEEHIHRGHREILLRTYVAR